MKITRKFALEVWQYRHRDIIATNDFHGKTMFRNAYGASEAKFGWNIHHIIPKSLGGTDEIENLICTNIETNEAAGNKTTFWIDNCLYQVRHGEIVLLEKTVPHIGFPNCLYIDYIGKHKYHVRNGRYKLAD
jgi:hypothetical protein